MKWKTISHQKAYKILSLFQLKSVLSGHLGLTRDNRHWVKMVRPGWYQIAKIPNPVW